MTAAPNLHSLQWRNRVLLIFSERVDDPKRKKQTGLLQLHQSGITERDIEVFKLAGHTAKVRHLRSKFNVQSDAFAVVFIGKDGSRKLLKKEPVEPDDLFKLIDSMPMRRAEVSAKQGKIKSRVLPGRLD